MKTTTIVTASIAAVAAALVAGPATAHTLGVSNTGGFAVGFAHPLAGLDHVLAMAAVGLWAAHMGGHARWLVPASFLAMMAAAGAGAVAGLQVPFTEIGISLSVAALGVLIWARARPTVALGMALVGGFALFHGAAHGLAAAADGAVITYSMGFLTATALLHAAGLGLGVVSIAGPSSLSKGLSPATARVAGGAMGLAGIAFLAA